MDGSQKLPQRMLDSVRWHLVHQKPFPLLALGVAGWMRYVGGVDEQGNAIEVSDPQLAVIQAAVNGSAEGESRVSALLGIEAIFGNELPKDAVFVAAVMQAYQTLLQKARRPRLLSTPPGFNAMTCRRPRRHVGAQLSASPCESAQSVRTYLRILRLQPFYHGAPARH